MNERLGCVLIFKAGITREQAKKALEKLKDVVLQWPDPFPDKVIQGFNPDHGYPVWYIP
jgi:hypothetical protein